MNQLLSDQPVGVDFGTLDNGLRYYVRCNSKPRMRAALALAVRVGLVILNITRQRVCASQIIFSFNCLSLSIPQSKFLIVMC